jgi:hypothetical protein
VVQKPVEHRGNGGGVSEELPPVLDRSIRRKQGAGPLVSAHDQLKQVLTSAGWKLSHAKVIDDEEGWISQDGHRFFATSCNGGVGEFLEQGVGLAVQDFVALLDDRASNGLGDVAFPVPGGPRKSASSCLVTGTSECGAGRAIPSALSD